MVYFSSEENFWWNHWVLVGEEELADEESTFVGSFGRTGDLNMEMSEVVGRRLCVDSDNRVLGKSLRLLGNTRVRHNLINNYN